MKDEISAIDLIDDPKKRVDEIARRAKKLACIYCGVTPDDQGCYRCPFKRCVDGCEDLRQREKAHARRANPPRFMRYAEVFFNLVMAVAIILLLVHVVQMILW